MSLFRLDASIKVEGSASREIADVVEQHWLATHPGDRVVRRHIGTEPLPSDAWAARRLGLVDPGRGPHSRAAGRRRAGHRPRPTSCSRPTRSCSPCRSTTSASPSTSRPGSTSSSPTRGARPARCSPASRSCSPRCAVARTAPAPRARAGTTRPPTCAGSSADVWGADLTVVEREFTLVGVNPALDEFTDLAEELHQEALATAEEAGRALAASVCPRPRLPDPGTQKGPGPKTGALRACSTCSRGLRSPCRPCHRSGRHPWGRPSPACRRRRPRW